MDEWVVRFAVDHRVAWLDSFTIALMRVGTSFITDAIVALVVVVWCVRTRQWQPAAWLFGAGAVAVVGADVLKAAIDRPRPPVGWSIALATGPAMPSSVAALTAASAVVLLATVRGSSYEVRRGATVAALVALLVAGASVVYIGVHWPSDVLAGWMVGAASAVVVIWAITRFDELFVQPRRRPDRRGISAGA